MPALSIRYVPKVVTRGSRPEMRRRALWLVETCPSCNRSDVGDGRFCRSCGQMLRAPKGVKLASFEQRLKGFIVDGFALFTAAIVGLIFLLELLDVFDLNNVLLAVLIVISGGLFGIWALWWLLILNQSQTPGKQLAGTRVMEADTGQPAGLVRTIFRESVAKTATAIVFGWFFAIHVLWALWDPDRKGLYDKIAGTVVVDDREYRRQQAAF